MAYGENILSTNAGDWDLQNATLLNGVLSINAGGSARLVVNEQMLNMLTATFMVNLAATGNIDNYNPECSVKIFAKTYSDKVDVLGTIYNYTLFPTMPPSGIYTTIIEMMESKYEYFVVTFESSVNIDFGIFEVCPETSDTDVSAIIDGVEQSLPKLLYDYNTDPQTTEQYEATIAIISCNVLKDTDIQGHFLWTFVATKPGKLTLRFKDNESTELWCPLYYDIHAGRNTVGVPHSYLHRLKGIHTFIVTAQISEGIIKTGIRGILFTIDAGYIATRIYTLGANISDIEMRRPVNSYEPDFIYIASIEEKKPTIRRIKYSNPTSAAEPVYVVDMEGSSDVKICFEGTWSKVSQSDKYKLETLGDPWIFWTCDGVLYRQYFDDETTRVVIANHVTAFDTVFGFRSIHDKRNDQGIVVIYIADGLLYQISKIWNVATNTYRWEDLPEVITQAGENLIECSVERTNDYRIRIVATNESENLVLDSARTYVGGSVPDEQVNISFPNYEIYGCVAELAETPLVSLNQCKCKMTDSKTLQVTFPYNVAFGYSYVNSIFEDPRGEVYFSKIEITDNVITFKSEQPITHGFELRYLPASIKLWVDDHGIRGWYAFTGRIYIPDVGYTENIHIDIDYDFSCALIPKTLIKAFDLGETNIGHVIVPSFTASATLQPTVKKKGYLQEHIVIDPLFTISFTMQRVENIET